MTTNKPYETRAWLKAAVETLRIENKKLRNELAAIRSAQPLPQAGDDDTPYRLVAWQIHKFLQHKGFVIGSENVPGIACIIRDATSDDKDERIAMVNPNHPCYGVDLWMCREQDVELAKGQGYISFQEYAAQRPAQGWWPEWGLLDPDDVIQPDDEFMAYEEWDKADPDIIGRKSSSMFVRRRLPAPDDGRVTASEAFDNLSVNVAQISLRVDYLYESLNTLSYLCNGLHERISKLEAAHPHPAQESESE